MSSDIVARAKDEIAIEHLRLANPAVQKRLHQRLLRPSLSEAAQIFSLRNGTPAFLA